MSSIVRHFVLGLVLGFLTIVMLYVMYSSVIIGENEVNNTSAVLIVVGYGVVTAILGELSLLEYPKKKK